MIGSFYRDKTLESLPGIETRQASQPAESSDSDKTLESLPGIETRTFFLAGSTAWRATKPLNPYQGLKQRVYKAIVAPLFATKPLNPYQGLKQGGSEVGTAIGWATKPLNPYLLYFHNFGRRFTLTSAPLSHQTSAGYFH